MFMDFVILLKNKKPKDVKQTYTENCNSMRIQILYLTWNNSIRIFYL
jgi:hypothetical protein